MRTAERGLRPNTQLVKKRTWKCQGERVLVNSTWPRFGSYRPWLVRQQQRTWGTTCSLTRRALADKSHACRNVESLSPHMAAPHPGHSDLHIYQHTLAKTLLVIKFITSELLAVAYIFYFQRIPSLLGFIIQPSPCVIHECPAIFTLQKRNCATETKPRFPNWIRHFTLCWIPVGVRWLQISEIWVMGWGSHRNPLGPLGTVPSLSKSRLNNLSSGICSLFPASEILNSY